MNVLVIYEVVPEETRVYLVNMNDEIWNKFKYAHNCFLNTNLNKDEEEACEAITEFLKGRQPIDTTLEDGWDTDGIHIDRIILTGFML